MNASYYCEDCGNYFGPLGYSVHNASHTIKLITNTPEAHKIDELLKRLVDLDNRVKKLEGLEKK
jgi:hypothetical protein